MMEYQKIINLLDNASNQPSIIRTKNWIEINDESSGTYNTIVKFKTTMLNSSLSDHSDAYILVKGNIVVNNKAVEGTDANNVMKK